VKPASILLPSLLLALLHPAMAAAQPAPPVPPTAAPPAPATPAPPAPPPATTPTVAPAAPPAARWYDRFQLEAFVDAYIGVNYNFPTTKESPNVFRAYDASNGVALHWVGLNVTYPANPVGGTVSVRLGPAAGLHAAADAAIDLTFLKQAYATWKPGGENGRFTLDFGKYDQPFGSESADTQLNMNYTRSLVYWYAQPLFFTGFRATLAAHKTLDVKAFLVNGWNASRDNNAGKSGGVQLVWKPSDAFVASLGYLLGPEQNDSETVTCAAGTAYDPKKGACMAAAGAAGGTTEVAHTDANKRLRHLADLVLDITPTKDLHLLFNATFDHDEVPGAKGNVAVNWYGANLALRYAFTDQFSLAGRGEVYWDPDGYSTGTGKSTRVVDGTLTLGISPTPNFLVKLDGRVDGANAAFFKKGEAGTSKVQVTTTLGVVATTN
jgi:hypothetical protein